MLPFCFFLLAVLIHHSSAQHEGKNLVLVHEDKLTFSSKQGNLRSRRSLGMGMGMGMEGSYPGDGPLCDQDRNRTRDQMHNCTNDDDCDQLGPNWHNGTWSDDGNNGDGWGSGHPCYGNYSDDHGNGPFGNYSDGFHGMGGPCGNFSDDSGSERGPCDGTGDGFGPMGEGNHHGDCERGDHHGCDDGQDSNDANDNSGNSGSTSNNGSEQMNYQTAASMASIRMESLGIAVAAFSFLLA